MPRASPTPRLLALSLGLAGSTACAAPGPPTWPTSAEATRAARRHGPSDESLTTDLLARLEASDGDGFRSLLAPEVTLDDETFDRASAALRARGRLLGVHEERSHREGRLRWYAGLFVARKAPGRRTQLMLRYAVDAFGRVVHLELREHPFREDVCPPVDDYETVTRMRLPSDGTWIVLQGGHGPEVNNHWHNHEQRHAYDLVVRRGGRVRATLGEDVDNAAHYAYGRPILAPAPGVVVFARDGVPDNPPGVRGEKGGNGVIISHGFGEYTAIWHMIPGTLRVRVGDRVEWGQQIGQVGNSGRSTLPHIHVHVVSGPPGGSPAALPLRWVDVRVDGEPRAIATPERNQRVAHAPESRPERPRSDRAWLLRF